MTPDGFAKFIRTDYENMREAAKVAGITRNERRAAARRLRLSLPRIRSGCALSLCGAAQLHAHDVPLQAYLALLDRLGFDRGVLVQPSAYGRDNRAMLDALTRAPARLRGVAVGGAELNAATLHAMARGRRAWLARQRIPP